MRLVRIVSIFGKVIKFRSDHLKKWSFILTCSLTVLVLSSGLLRITAEGERADRILAFGNGE